MTFTFNTYEDKITPLTQELRDKLPPDLDHYQALLEQLQSKNAEKQHRRALLKYLIIDQFLNVLIDIYENPRFKEGSALSADAIREYLNALKTDKLRLTNEINKTYGTKASKEDKKGSLIALTPYVSQYMPNSYSFDTNTELQHIVEEMSALFMKNNEKTPITFFVQPPYDSSRQEDPVTRNKQIIENILTAAAKQGYAPEDIKINISNVPQAISAKELGETRYENWVRDAKKIRDGLAAPLLAAPRR